MNGRSGESARPRCASHELLGHQRAQVVVGEQLDRVQLVRGAEPVEEVHERHPRPRASRPARRAPGRAPPGPMPSASSREARLRAPPSRRSGRRRSRAPAPRASARRHGARPGSARRRSCTCSGSSASRPWEAVNVVASAPPGARRAARRRHRLRSASRRPTGRCPRRSPPLARPLVGELGHRRRRRDRVDAADLVQAVGDRGGGLVAVDVARISRAPRPSRSRAPGTARSRHRSRCSGRSRTR